MKQRLDVLLVEQGFFQDADKAKRFIMAGKVIVNEIKIEKPGTLIKIDENKELKIRIKDKDFPYVSRGGLKLEKAFKVFSLNFQRKTILDVGSSTGGFTHFCLLNGAKHVYAVDVGTNQLDWSLRNNENVTSIENTHIRDLRLEEINNSKIDFIVMDVSFISITNVFQDLKKFFSLETKLMALIKPQFEVEKFMLAKGIVKEKEHQIFAIERVINEAKKHGLYLENLDYSPIKGGKGNLEFISLFGIKNKERNINIGKIIDGCKL